LAYILAAIGDAEGISVSNEEAVVAVRKAAHPLPVHQREQTIARLDSQKEEVRGILLEDKVFDFILDHASITRADDSKEGA
jgi:FKBP-type peptidyl-prolyl cis-trans isomerase (trigger factor)